MALIGANGEDAMKDSGPLAAEVPVTVFGEGYGLLEASTTRWPLEVREHSALLYPDESYKIMGACFAVHNELGAGFLEAVYHEALSIEFNDRGIPFVSRQPLPVTYRGRELKQGYAADFVVFGCIILEIKSDSALCDMHRAQTMNYLKATGFDLGLLVNFGSHPKLEFERIACTRGRYVS
jgi:GxxExxY protein